MHIYIPIHFSFIVADLTLFIVALIRKRDYAGAYIATLPWLLLGFWLNLNTFGF